MAEPFYEADDRCEAAAEAVRALSDRLNRKGLELTPEAFGPPAGADRRGPAAGAGGGGGGVTERDEVIAKIRALRPICPEGWETAELVELLQSLVAARDRLGAAKWYALVEANRGPCDPRTARGGGSPAAAEITPKSEIPACGADLADSGPGAGLCHAPPVALVNRIDRGHGASRQPKANGSAAPSDHEDQRCRASPPPAGGLRPLQHRQRPNPSGPAP
jgi:hypothetical protein